MSLAKIKKCQKIQKITHFWQNFIFHFSKIFKNLNTYFDNFRHFVGGNSHLTYQYFRIFSHTHLTQCLKKPIDRPKILDPANLDILLTLEDSDLEYLQFPDLLVIKVQCLLSQLQNLFERLLFLCLFSSQILHEIGNILQIRFEGLVLDPDHKLASVFVHLGQELEIFWDLVFVGE